VGRWNLGSDPPPSGEAEAFVAARVEQRHAELLSLARFGANDYSVSAEFAHRRVSAIGTVDKSASPWATAW
jgi:hypothetical protein